MNSPLVVAIIIEISYNCITSTNTKLIFLLFQCAEQTFVWYVPLQELIIYFYKILSYELTNFTPYFNNLDLYVKANVNVTSYLCRLGRFKKIVCSLPKTHHLFLIHRLVTRRNRLDSVKTYTGPIPRVIATHLSTEICF